MSKFKIVIWAALAAVITETVSALIFFNFGHMGGDGPDAVGLIGMILHFPGMLLANPWDGWPAYAIIESVSVLQYFVIYWAAILLWNGARRRPRRRP
jgi:hypothetical protein